MAKTACLYEEEEVINDEEHTVLECTRWQSYRSVSTSIIETITVANIIRIMNESREN